MSAGPGVERLAEMPMDRLKRTYDAALENALAELEWAAKLYEAMELKKARGD